MNPGAQVGQLMQHPPGLTEVDPTRGQLATVQAQPPSHSLGLHPCIKPHGILDQISWNLVEVDYTALLAALIILLIVYG